MDKCVNFLIDPLYKLDKAEVSSNLFIYNANWFGADTASLNVFEDGGKLAFKANNLPTSSLTDATMWAMISVALSEEDTDLDTLTDGKKIYEICEGYANTGILPLITLDETGEIGNYQSKFEDKFKKYME